MKKNIGRILCDKFVDLRDKLSDDGNATVDDWVKEMISFLDNITNLDDWGEINQQWNNRYNGSMGSLSSNLIKANDIWKAVNAVDPMPA